eukprot:GEMP01061701.1.p1 GENE.GEMP01061701.1~~GEMP01061701.1.p1  ORF type:complete len:215 (+),score=45.79 GEMP01061701.1:169-813(+)
MTEENAKDFLKDYALKTLQNHPKVRNVVSVERPPVTVAQLHEWEQKNDPYILPEDYKGFLLSMDGFELSWYLLQRTPNAVNGSDSMQAQSTKGNVMLTGVLETSLFGRMHLNPLSEVIYVVEDDESPFKAFHLDNKCEGGAVCLRYKSPTRCEVWHMDLAGSWAFIAGSFSDYYRLLLAHLGIPRWQCIFSANGLDPTASFWVRWLTQRPIEEH